VNYPLDYVSFESIGGTTKKAMRFTNPADRHWSAFNPSIGMAPDGSMAMTIRSSNYILKPEIGKYEVVTGNLIKNKTWFCKVDDNLELSELSEINYYPVSYMDVSVSMVRGAEDAKLFWRDGGWKFTAVLKEPDFGIPIPRIAVFNFDGQNAQLTNIEHFNDESPDVAEKNWMTPYEVNPNFDYIYNENHIVKDNELIKTRENSDVIENLRGGSNLWDLGDGTYLGITHRTFVKWINYYDAPSFGYKKSHVRNYYHYFVRYDYQGKIIEMSRAFKFLNSGVEFGAGLIVKNGEVIISFGENDCTAYFGTITLKSVINFMEKV
jgi:hypothetical protein